MVISRKRMKIHRFWLFREENKTKRVKIKIDCAPNHQEKMIVAKINLNAFSPKTKKQSKKDRRDRS